MALLTKGMDTRPADASATSQKGAWTSGVHYGFDDVVGSGGGGVALQDRARGEHAGRWTATRSRPQFRLLTARLARSVVRHSRP